MRRDTSNSDRGPPVFSVRGAFSQQSVCKPNSTALASPKFLGVPSHGPDKDYSILGSILGSVYLRKLPGTAISKIN